MNSARFRVRFEPGFTGLLLLLLAVPASGQDEQEEPQADGAMSPAADQWELPAPDMSAWRCRNCPFGEGWSGSFELGAGNVSDDSFEFGDYRGLEEEGAFAVVGGEALFRGENGRYFDLWGEEFGLDTRSARVEGGRQGRYGIRLEYDELPHFSADDTRTVFSGSGSSDLTLPAGWVRAGTTGGMTGLDDSLRDVDIEQQRESLGLGLDLQAGDHWRFDVEARQDTLEGNGARGGAFLFSSALLPAPVDYRTDRIDASVAYVRERWQMAAGLHSSMFTNENEALSWDNPFTSGFGADRGQLALEPDNQFNQLSLSGSWRARDSLTVAGRLALGRAEQDEDFLAPTVNGSLAAPSLPRNDLDGEVDTRTLDLRITGRPGDRLTASAEVFYDERDNNTPRDDFVQVVTDSIVSSAETNTPFSHERSGAEVTLDYRFSRAFTLAGSVRSETTERTFQDVEETETDTFWVEARGRPSDRVSVRARQTFEQRDSDHEPFDPDPADNPDLRSFYLAERERTATLLAVDWFMTDRISAALSTEFGEDDYTDTDIGLAMTEHYGFTFDISAALGEGISAYGFVSTQTVDAEILGADNVAGTLWRADQSDQYDTLGAGIEVADLPGKWKTGRLNLTYAAGESGLTIDKGSNEPPFPDLDTHRTTLELTADRELRKDLELRLGYLVEDLRQDDFYIDRVEPETIPSVLTLGDEPFDGTVHVIQVSVRYVF